MKLALNQARRIAIAFVVAFVGLGMTPSSIQKPCPPQSSEEAVRIPAPAPKPAAIAVAIAATAPATRPRRSPSNAAYDHIIAEHADRFGVDAALVKAIIHAESSFRPKAKSRAGARGLMQLMPRTAGMYGVASRDLFQPHSNIHAGVRHLRRLLDRFAGDVRLAVAAYNAGATAVRRHGGLPPFRETRDYVQKVLRLHARYAEEVTVALRDRDEKREKIAPS